MNTNLNRSTHRQSPRFWYRLAVLSSIILASGALANPAPRPAFVPWPQEYKAGTGVFVAGAGGRVVYEDKSLAPLAAILVRDIRMATGVALAAIQAKPEVNDIALRLDSKLQKESYVLTVTDKGILLVGQDYNALAMGTVTLVQSLDGNGKGAITVPAYAVKDWCFAEYSGLMLDIARQEHSMEVLRDVIDMCRFYKVRFFRLHFSDDCACLFPFESYPQITP